MHQPIKRFSMQPLPVTIPNPCHENWNGMTAAEQGRFCGKCCKTVIDFSSKTNDEILSILKSKQSERVCGHFNTEQVNLPQTVTISLLQNGRQISFRNIFLLSLFIVFGTTLFSCRDANNRTIGKIELVNKPDEEKRVTLGMIVAPFVDTIIIPEEQHLLRGEAVYEPPVDTTIEWVSEKIMGDTIYSIPHDIKGKIKSTATTAEQVTSIECFPTDPKTTLPDIQTFTLGMIVREETVDTTDSGTISNDTGLTITGERVSETMRNETTFTVYPNPGKNNFNLKLNATQKEIYEIALYDVSGKLVQQLYNSYMTSEGIQTLLLNIEQPPGVYFVILRNAVHRLSQKIVIEE